MSNQPTSAEEVVEAVRAHSRVAARGGGSKARLVGAGEVIDLRALSGVTEYEASEYTFTARAGTPVSELVGALEGKGQYLPFDPCFVEAGATLGGTVASGISGPGRFRYGGLRDFLLGIQFVDGAGRLVRSGGKVVKNAAGFDLPKFMVGSLGGFGILTEVCFKVFPAPVATLTLEVACKSVVVAVERLVAASKARWEVDAMEFDPVAGTLMVRIGAPPGALGALGREIEQWWPGEVRRLEPDEALRYWRAAREPEGLDRGALVKVAISPSRIEELEARLAGLTGAKRRYSSGGAAGWIAVKDGDVAALDRILKELKLEGLMVRGGGDGSPRLGHRVAGEIFGAVKLALDPKGRFPTI